MTLTKDKNKPLPPEDRLAEAFMRFNVLLQMKATKVVAAHLAAGLRANADLAQGDGINDYAEAARNVADAIIAPPRPEARRRRLQLH